MELIKLKYAVDILTGYTFKGNKYSDKGIRVVRGENVTEGKLRWDTIKCWNIPFDKEELYKLKADDVVIGMDGSKVGKNKARIFLEDLPLLLAQRVACLRTNENVDQVYLYYCINNPRFEEYVSRIQTGSSVPHISKTQIEDFQIPLPDLAAQKQIAKVLLGLDAKIALNNKINQELEAMAKTLYDYWFVQFDFLDANGKPYKSSGGKMVFNAELKREIPEGWDNGLAKDLFQFNPTLSIKKGNVSSYIDMNALPVNGFMTKKLQKKAFGGGMKFQNDDVVMARITPCLENGKTGLISLLNDDEIGFGSTEFIVIRGIDLKLKSFACCLSRSEKFRKHAISKMTGTSGRKRVKADALANFKMPIPSKEILEYFEKTTSCFFDKMNVNAIENQKLSELRDWLLPMLMNGQVSVEEVESELSMVSDRYIKYGKE